MMYRRMNPKELEKVIEEVKKYNEGWDAAIEAAALIVQPIPHVDEERKCEDIALKIRKLKKCT